MFRHLKVFLSAVCLGLLMSVTLAEAPAIKLVNIYRKQIDVTRYLVSEKYDGMRAIWDS